MTTSLVFVKNLFILFVAIFVWLKMIAWVSEDVKKRRLSKARFWTTMVFFFNVFGFTAYLLAKHQKSSIKCGHCGFNLSKEAGELNLSVCPKCKGELHLEVAYEIFFDNIRHFNPHHIEIFDYEAHPLTEIFGNKPLGEIWNVLKFYLDRAIRNRVTDIHLDPEKEKIRIRQRIDGVLYDVISPPKDLGIKLTATLKTLSGLDVAKKKRPQSGRFEVKIGSKRYDLRVSTSHAIFGEKIAIRILDRDGELLDLKKLGFSKDELLKLEDVISQPSGMILVCGPTGSGKTTTLYGVLKEINWEKRNIMTIEDPVEYELEGISQQQVSRKAGIDFASGLRSMLRQDPDIIVVGEVRDAETARIANQAADTGHLVLSTMHSIDAIGVMTRLRDFGVSSHYLSSTISVIVAQRLIRLLCSDCKEEIIYDDAPEDSTVRNVYKPVGCINCNYTGYHGRTGIFEILVFNKELRDLVYRDVPLTSIRDNYPRWGVKNLKESGLSKVLAGETTIEEVDAVVPGASFFSEKEK